MVASQEVSEQEAEVGAALCCIIPEKADVIMSKRVSRRSFLGAGLAAAALPALAGAQGQEPELRRVIDAVTGEGLPGLSLIAKRVGARGRWKFVTDADGFYPFGEMIASLSGPAKFRIRIKSKQLDGRHIGYEGYFLLYPGTEANTGVGDIGLIPLYPEAFPFSFSDVSSEAEFRERWLTLLRELFFSVDRQPTPRPRRTDTGAIAAFAGGDLLTVRVTDELTSAEYNLVRQGMGAALKVMTRGIFTKRRFRRVPAADTALPPQELPRGTITVTRRADFPRPAVRLRYGNTNPYDEGANPHEIFSALVILDNFTLDELYRDGNGSPPEKTYARHLLQRCTAYALGWRPTLLLPNASVVDDNYGPPGAYVRRTITPVDRALAAVITGGGSGCYAPGFRFDRIGKMQLLGDPLHPISAGGAA